METDQKQDAASEEEECLTNKEELIEIIVVFHVSVAFLTLLQRWLLRSRVLRQ